VKAITVRNVPPRLAQAIRRRAKERGLSLNKAIITILEESIGEGRQERRRDYHDLDHLFGTWTAEDAETFDADLSNQRRIDPELWR
jgi:hypothetical protein